VATGHLGDHLGDGSVDSGISVLLVHIVSIGTRFITEPDTVVLDESGTLIVKLGHTKDLTTGALGAVDTFHKVPKLGSGDDRVLSEELHLEDFRDRDLRSGGGTSDDLVVVNASASGVGLDLTHGFLHHFVG